MLNSRSIQGIIILALAIFVAIWLGMSIVTDQFETLVQFAAAAVLITAALLGRKVWLLLIFFSALNIVLIRGIGTTDVGQILFLGISLALFLMRKLKYQIKIGELEIWTLLIIACIVQAYMRNPVGLNIFGAGNVGGRPYIVLILSISSAVVLSTLRVEAKEIKWAMGLTLVAGFFGIIGQRLRGADFSAEGFSNVTGGSMDRIPALSTFSQTVARWLSSRLSPLRACLHPLWGFVLLCSLAAAAGSGYRNSVAAVGAIYFFGICYHGGVKSVLLALFGGSIALVLLAFVNSNAPLPANIQRALSPLPGTWEERYVRQADNSTEWRMEMWKEALTSDRWIRNKTFGDGIGMTVEQLASNESTFGTQNGRAASGLLYQQEAMLINGSYHSGPVHTIRAAGYVGLAVLLMFMIRVAVHAHRQIVRCRGTEWFPIALFFGIPLLTQPIIFTFVFGEFQYGVSGTLMGMAMIRLMEKNLPLPAWKKQVRVPFILKSNRASTRAVERSA